MDKTAVAKAKAKQAVYNARKSEPEKYNEYQKQLMREKRAADPEGNKARNAENNRAYRARIKAKKEAEKQKEQEQKAVSTIRNNIKIHLAKKELTKLKEAKEQQTLKEKIIEYKKKVGRPKRTPEQLAAFRKKEAERVAATRAAKKTNK